MSLWDAWFGTATEKKREQYKALYNELNKCLTSFNTKLQTMENKVDAYMSGRPTMSESFIPEDVFSSSELRVKNKVDTIKGNQASDYNKLNRAVEEAYQRYQYYARLAEQERLEREAEQRRQAERRRQEASKRNRR